MPELTPPDPDLDRDATAADLQPGNVLAYMIIAGRRRDHRAARQHRQHLRRCGFSVTLGKLDPYDHPGQLGFSLDLMIRAMAANDFHLAGVHRRSLARSGVNVVPLPAKAEGRAR